MTTAHEKLLDEHKEAVAAAWRKLERRVRRFERELVTGVPPNNEIPIGPVLVYPTQYAPLSAKERAQGKEPQLIKFLDPYPPKKGKQLAADAIAQLEYIEDEPKNRSVRCYGAIGVSMRLIQQIQGVNRAKDAFRDALKPLSGKTMRVSVRHADGSSERVMRELITVMMRRLELARVNVLAAYRHIPVFDEQVRTLRFNHVTSKSVEKKTAEQLIDMLANSHESTAGEDIARLRQIPEDEPLSRRKSGYDRVMARITAARRYQHEESGRMRYYMQQIPAELPVFFPMHPSWPEPEINKPSFERYPRTKENQRQKKARGRLPALEDEAFITTWDFRRKREPYRSIEKEERDKKKKTLERQKRRQGPVADLLDEVTPS
jgi:hypothetical protein